MGTALTQWNLTVSTETDQSVREFLASEDGIETRDLSQFVEEAVRKHIFNAAAQAAKANNANVDPDELDAIIDESLTWARTQRHE